MISPLGKWLYPWDLGIQAYLELVLFSVAVVPLDQSRVRKKTHDSFLFATGESFFPSTVYILLINHFLKKTIDMNAY